MKAKNIFEKYNKCVERTVKDGVLEIRCKRGLWVVSGSDHEFTEREARHYWMQYHSDGEYATILMGEE